MCGIAAFIKHPSIENDLIKKMIGSIQHRGPDHIGFFEDEFISMAHARLSILDLSENAHQPFHSEDGRYIMIYNGEVYNFRELSREMNYSPKTGSDTEIVLEAYRIYGDEFVDKLNGMFAIVIYDQVEKSLHVWRDRFGIKPLFYYWNGECLALASELKALYELAFPKELDPKALNEYLHFEYIPKPNTIYKNFKSLFNGHKLTYRNGKVSVESYYDLLEKIQPLEIDEDKALSRLEEELTKSIEYRRISDVSLGIFLSGGVDSSNIAAGLRSLTDDVSSFNIGFKNRQFDESKYAEEVAKELGLNHTSHVLSEDDYLENLSESILHYDQPFAVASIFPTLKVSELARKNVTVALSGDGGDELFMGYGHYAWMNRLKNLDSGVGKGFRSLSSDLLKLLPKKYNRPSKLLDYNLLSKDWPHIWSQDQYMFSRDDIQDLTGNQWEESSVYNDWQRIQNSTSDVFQQASLFDMRNYLADDLLYKVDIASMKHSLEVRLPFLDHHLVEYVINLPTTLKFQKDDQKYLLKKHLSKFISRNLVYRKKWGFGAPTGDWIKSDLKALVSDQLSPDTLKKQGIFDPKFVGNLLEKFNNGHNYLDKKIWSILVFQIWHNKF